jgi:SAM-dependent methyltransferase
VEEKMAYIFGDYLVEFVKDGEKLNGEAVLTGETTPAGKVCCHFYNHNNPEDTSHKKDDSLHIDILRVQAGHDKKGLGTFLVKKVLEYAEKYKVKHVTTTPSPTGRITMATLRRFYLKFKYQSGFLPKKIEFVDEDYLMADVLEEVGNSKGNDSLDRIVGDTSSNKQNSEGAVNNSSSNIDKSNKASKASKVAYLTVVHFLDEHLKSKNDILQIGASGASVYGIYLARKGHHVTVIEPKRDETEKLAETAQGIDRLTVINQPYAVLYDVEDECKDAVLCFGPMYSTLSLEEKEEIIRESYRICKPGGTIFISFMSNDMMVIENTFNSDYDFMIGPRFDKITLKAVSRKMRILTFEEIDALFKMCEIRYTERFAAEGVAMLIRDKMEDMNEKQFNRWLNYHYIICKKDELMGCSNHVVYVINKPEETSETDSKEENADSAKDTDNEEENSVTSKIRNAQDIISELHKRRMEREAAEAREAAQVDATADEGETTQSDTTPDA